LALTASARISSFYHVIEPSSASIADLVRPQRRYWPGNFYGGLYFLVFFGITLVFIAVGIVTNTLQLLDSRMAEYAIHLLSGAKMSHLYSRVVIYLLLLVSLPVIIVSAYVSLIFRVPLYTGLIRVHLCLCAW